MDEGDADPLGGLVERLRAFGATVAEDAAKEAAPLIQEALRATAAAGTDPYGKAWPSKKAGGRALPDAAGNITVSTVGPVVRAKVTGGYAIQNYLKGEWRRQTLPDAGKALPKAVVEALKEGARRAWAKVVG